MRKLDYVLIGGSYIISTLVSVTSEYQTVTNPVPSDYLVGGLGGLVGAFLISSVFTLPIQFTSGWKKESYIRKTVYVMPIILSIGLISNIL